VACLNTKGKRHPNGKRSLAVCAGYGDVLAFFIGIQTGRIPLLHGRADWVVSHQVGDSLKELVWRVLGFPKKASAKTL